MLVDAWVRLSDMFSQLLVVSWARHQVKMPATSTECNLSEIAGCERTVMLKETTLQAFPPSDVGTLGLVQSFLKAFFSGLSGAQGALM